MCEAVPAVLGPRGLSDEMRQRDQITQYLRVLRCLKRWQALLQRGRKTAGKAGLAACKDTSKQTRNAHAAV